MLKKMMIHDEFSESFFFDIMYMVDLFFQNIPAYIDVAVKMLSDVADGLFTAADSIG